MVDKVCKLKYQFHSMIPTNLGKFPNRCLETVKLKNMEYLYTTPIFVQRGSQIINALVNSK